MAASAISGDVAQVRLENVNVAGTRVSSDKDLPLQIESGAEAPEYVSSQDTPRAAFTDHHEPVDDDTRPDYMLRNRDAGSGIGFVPA